MGCHLPVSRGHQPAIAPAHPSTTLRNHVRSTRSLLPLTHRNPPCGDGAHRPLQLGLRPPHRGETHLPHRRHRRRPRLRRILPSHRRLPHLARHGLGRGCGERRPARPLPAIAAHGHLRRRAGKTQTRRICLPRILHRRRSRGPAQSRRPRPQTRLRQLRP